MSDIKDNVSNSFERKLLEKKIENHLKELNRLASELPKQYIDGNIDSTFKSIYKQGAGADEDNFGRLFAHGCVAYAVQKMKDNASNPEIQQFIFQNFVLSIRGLIDPVFSNACTNFKNQIADPLMGLDNYAQLATDFKEHIKINTHFYDSKKVIIDNCFKLAPPLKVVKRKLRVIK